MMMTDQQALDYMKILKLREITGRDMMSCTKALVQSDWDIKSAVKWFAETSVLTTAYEGNTNDNL